MSTKDFLRNIAVTIIPYADRQKPVREGVITETGIKDAIIIETDEQNVRMDFICTDPEAVMLLRDKRPVIAREYNTNEPFYIIETLAL